MADDSTLLRKTLADALDGGQAHATLQDATSGLPVKLLTTKPAGSPHNAWQLIEHIRIALEDLLEFCRNPKYKAMRWPDDYWPPADANPGADDWERSRQAISTAMHELQNLVRDPATDLEAKIAWGDGQTILREVLLAVDHTSYHTGQLVMLRKQLDQWED